MSSFIIVVDNDLNDFTFLEEESIRVHSVYLTVYGERTRRHDRVECRHLWANIRDVVEEGTRIKVSDDREFEYLSGPTSLHHHPSCPSSRRAL